jgi:hypothetical protein
MRNTKYITFSAIISALSVVVLLLGSLLNVLDLTAVFIASLFLLIAREEMGWGAFGIYFVTLAISLLLPNTMVAAIEYAIIAVFPIFRPAIERLNAVLKWFLKVLYMLLAAGGIFVVSRILVADAPLYADILLALGSLVILFLYDVLLFRFMMYYRFKLRNRLRIDRFFNQY